MMQQEGYIIGIILKMQNESFFYIEKYKISIIDVEICYIIKIPRKNGSSKELENEYLKRILKVQFEHFHKHSCWTTPIHEIWMNFSYSKKSNETFNRL